MVDMTTPSSVIFLQVPTCVSTYKQVRVTSKSTLRSVRTRNGEMAVFDLELTDEAGTQIRATLWGAYAEQQHGSLKDSGVYYIHKGRLKMADQRYAVVKNPYEMTLNQDSIIEECFDASEDFGQVRLLVNPFHGSKTIGKTST